MKGFTKCSNGHYYKEELASCPYCGGGNAAAGAATQSVDDGKTRLMTKPVDSNKTTVISGLSGATSVAAAAAMATAAANNNRTVFGDGVIKNIEGKQVVETEYRSSRMLVGWLVSYSFDRMGADFRLYEGRNVVGRDADCNITVHDKMMTGKHATILFKNDKYKIKDELSSHGTFVNDIDIEDEHVELHDGDTVKMGETVFKFKTSL